jgi:hypothetical protein
VLMLAGARLFICRDNTGTNTENQSPALNRLINTMKKPIALPLTNVLHRLIYPSCAAPCSAPLEI